ncbi:MAG: cardiolipin synthase, partial [Deltaproteobacteria bacterium]|nr:cardiolipin synthase [Deltaproteobacteria bacterium]
MEIFQSAAIFYYVLIGANLVITFLSAWHALLYKRDPKASVSWLAVIFMFPVFGYIFYFLFGVNRIRTRARVLTGKNRTTGFIALIPIAEKVVSPDSPSLLPGKCADIANVADSITGIPLTSGNRIDILHNGDEVYPSMLDAIENAEKSLFLSTYIFKTDSTGVEFIDRLAAARKRGVDVRVIIDGIGEYYSFPVAGWLLKKQGIDFARYIPPSLFPPSIHINLRNHRKILVADSKIAFTGGIN